MSIKLANNASGTLATAINASDTGIVLTTNDGAEFPTLGVGEYFYGTLESTNGTLEIVKVTARSGDSLTVERAQEGTSSAGFAAGALFEVRVTAQSVIDTIYGITNYQGADAANPTTRVDGTPLQVGDYYFNTTASEVRFYNGANWQSLTTGTIEVQNFAGNGVTTIFTLGNSPTGEVNTQVYLNGVYQQKDTYSVSGLSLIFSIAPPSGTTIEVVTIEAIAVGRTSADLVTYQPAGTGAVTTNVQTKLRETVSVKDFGAVGNGVTDDTAAIQAAVDAANYVYVPPGTYVVSSKLTITGTKTISGARTNSNGYQASVINHTAIADSLFSATSDEFGGISIQNLFIIGGNGSYAIETSRPLSNVENVVMEVYDGGGINLFNGGTGGTGGWGSTIRNCKWVAPASLTTYRGINIDTNGGHVTIDNFTGLRGQIGINIAQCEAVNLIACSINGQGVGFAAGVDSDIASIRLSGAGYKKAVAIKNCYIEGYVNGIYVEKCESLSIEDNYMADLGYAGGRTGYGIYLKDTNVNNVTIRNNNFSENSTQGNVVVDDDVNNVIIENNWMYAYASGAACIVNGNSTSVRYQNNLLQNNVSGFPIIDPNNTLVDQDYATGGFASKQIVNTLVLDGVWNDLVSVANNQIWQVRVTVGSSNLWRNSYEVIVDSTGTSAIETIYNVNPGYGVTLSIQVSGGKIQYRTSGGNAQLTAIATKLV
jgi:hypothetical protein